MVFLQLKTITKNPQPSTSEEADVRPSENKSDVIATVVRFDIRRAALRVSDPRKERVKGQVDCKREIETRKGSN